MATCFFDITDTVDHLAGGGGVTGIQRVVISMLAATQEHLGDRVRALVFRPGQPAPETFDPQLLRTGDRTLSEAFIAHFFVPPDRPQPLAEWLLKRYPEQPIRRRFHELRFRLAHAVGKDTLRRRHISVERPRDPFADVQLAPALLGEGDTVFALGALWARSGKRGAADREHALQAARAAGARIVVMVHDLIPHIFPEFVPRPHDRIFAEALGKAVDLADILVTNSEATARDLDAFIREGGGARPPIRVVALTQSFPAPRSRPYEIRRKVTRHIAAEAAQPFVLAVGSVDMRKNFPALARVWRALGDEIGPSMPRLIIAGRRSWNSKPFLDQLKGTGGFGGLVQLIEDANDLDIEYLYRRCLFTVLPSLYEGWGLPIGESLWFGKLCVASNASSMPEVGGDLADYFDPHDLDSMAVALRRPIVDPAYRAAREREIAAAELRDWSAAAADLIAAVAMPDRALEARVACGAPLPDIDLPRPDPLGWCLTSEACSQSGAA